MANKYVKLKDGSNYLLPVMYGIDTSNVITSGSTNYTATQDCYVCWQTGYHSTWNNPSGITIDGVKCVCGSTTGWQGGITFLRKGQTLVCAYATNPIVFGLKY